MFYFPLPCRGSSLPLFSLLSSAAALSFLFVPSVLPSPCAPLNALVDRGNGRDTERLRLGHSINININTQQPRFCARHKLPGMMDVRNRRCEEPDCTRQPSYGKEGQRRQFCFTHKRPGDVDVKSTRYGLFFDPKLKVM